MQLIEHIKQHGSVSIVGMAKNTGKTTCLNYILRQLAKQKHKLAVTSIGVDGEERDVLYDTLKPRITLYKGNIFITSEKHFNESSLSTELLETSTQHTALGRLITAEAQNTGQVILSGPSDAVSISQFIAKCHRYNTPLVLIDGALNRMSLASPAITDALVLCTGAACAIKLDQLIKKVKYQCELIQLPQISKQSAWMKFKPIKASSEEQNTLIKSINDMTEGVWGMPTTGESPLQLAKSLFVEGIDANDWLKKYRTIYIAGALTENFLKEIIGNNEIAGFNIVVNDFSHIFTTNATFHKFIRRGGSMQVRQRAQLLAVCSNPTSPTGYNFVPKVLQAALEAELNVPVYDIMATN